MLRCGVTRRVGPHPLRLQSYDAVLIPDPGGPYGYLRSVCDSNSKLCEKAADSLRDATRADGPPVYKICKNENEDCVAVTYNLGDPSKERVCREACGMTGEELNTKWTVYNCKGHEKECEAYDLGAKGDFDNYFARHVACVGTCAFLKKVAQTQHNYNLLCTANNTCQYGSYFSLPNVPGPFVRLFSCLSMCLIQGDN
ncbi:unnamed protein product [Dibothriocephalus latus]|uniref:Uncharacterized protein n=1 Tax=Dibothriocephalus latus TaxID=60516 RepID=A0A3P7LAN1_DIBLA|nr:unnamed protein product [Dibothriocephalus latus]